MAAEILHHLDTGDDIPEEFVVWIVAVHDGGLCWIKIEQKKQNYTIW